MKLGAYKGLKIRKPNMTVSESQIDKVLLRKQREYSVVIHEENGEKKRELQPLDDDFAKDFSPFETMAQWRGALRKKMEARKRASVTERMKRELLDLVIATSKLSVDKDLLDDVYEMVMDDFLDELEESGSTYEAYCKESGRTNRQIKKEKRQEALRIIQTESVLHAIIEAEQLSLTEEEMDDAIAAFAAEDGMEQEAFAATLDEDDLDSIQDQLLMDKATQLILEHAIFIS